MRGPPPTEIPLDAAPLVRVIAQVRYPLIASVETAGFIGPFQEAIRDEYPVLRPEKSRNVVLGPEGVISTRSDVSWRFHDESKTWRVTLAPGFLAIETWRYKSRGDFLDRLRRVLTELHTHVNPRTVDRLGVRYIDRVVGTNLRALSQLVRPEVAGILATPVAEDAQELVAQALFRLPAGEGQLRARWGSLPPRSTVDPAAVDPIDEPSWILDLDAFQQEIGAFDVEGIGSRARTLAERIYSVFRWVVTDEFHRRYGGQP